MLKLFAKKNNKKGFTLIELVVVIAILGILAGIILPRLLGFQERARAQADKQTAVQIRNALALLNANGEITLSDGGRYVVAKDATFTTTVTGINTIPAGATDGAGVEALIEGLTDNVTVQGTASIIVEVDTDGEIEVIQP